MNTAINTILLAILALLVALPNVAAAQPRDEIVKVRVEQVREMPVLRSLTLSGRVFSRHDASMGLTLSGELEWVLEPGTRVEKGEVIARLDQKPFLLRKSELEHQAARERVKASYLDKELKRLRQLRKDNNASERMLDESASNRDISRLELQSLQARIDQLDDEIRRSQLVAPFGGIIAERTRRGGEFARIGDVILRLVDTATLELRFQMPVTYLGRIAVGDTVPFRGQTGQSATRAGDYTATVRAIIDAANPSSQTFEVRADIPSPSSVIAGQLVNVTVPMSSGGPSLQIPRDAIVLRAEGSHIFRISSDDIAEKIAVEVGEGSRDWVSVKGQLSKGDWVAVRGVERLQDEQQVGRLE